MRHEGETGSPAPAPEPLLGLDPEVEPAPPSGARARATAPHAALVFLGGAIGVAARDALLHAAPAASRNAVPWMLLAINVVGAAALGALVARVLDPNPHAIGLRLLLATGVLGGFTTYSSLVSAAIVAGHDGHLGNGFLTLLATSVVGVGAAWLGSRSRARPA